MVEIVAGNILDAEAEAIVNTVNCVGVMDKGIALQFKQAHPENFKAYKRACDAKRIQPGRMFVFETGSLMNPKYIINFPTKRHWKGKSKIEDIQAGLQALIEEVRRLGIRSIAVPPLGCGNGGLAWSVIRPMIESAFKVLPDVVVCLYAPLGAPAAEAMPVRTEPPRMTRARALVVKIIQHYCMPGYRLTMLEIQKLAYFLQEAGEPLRLAYIPERYGPYAENLHFLLQRIEGHYIQGYGDRSQDARIRVKPEAIHEADEFLAGDEEASARFERVIRLIEGFETPYGMELLSTVYWVAKEEAPPARDADSAIKKVHAWNARKAKLFKPDHIRVAWQRLRDEQWLN